MDLVNHIAENYAEKYSSSLNNQLQEIEAYTRQHHPHAQMLSGQVQGKLLEMISKMIRPLHILEIGSFTGFSALCLVKGLQPGGKLHTIELRVDDAATAQEYFNGSGATHLIELHVGDALKIIPTLEPMWDLVFIDADKVNYEQYYTLTLPRVKPGGFILADNTLFHGEVLETHIKGKNAKAIHAFNELVAADERVEQVMMTIRDGLLLIRKL